MYEPFYTQFCILIFFIQLGFTKIESIFILLNLKKIKVEKKKTIFLHDNMYLSHSGPERTKKKRKRKLTSLVESAAQMQPANSPLPQPVTFKFRKNGDNKCVAKKVLNKTIPANKR